MILPALYAAIVWILAMRWRRQWLGYGVVVLGVAGLLAVDIGLRALDRALPSERPSSAVVAGAFSVSGSAVPPVPPRSSTTFLLQELLRPYIGVLAVLGVYIASLPRRAPTPAHCRKCFYDLRTLDPRGLSCPECGSSVAYQCEVCDHPFGEAEPSGLRCPQCAARWRGPGSAAPASVRQCA